MVKYVLTILNIDFTKNNTNNIINLRILYTMYLWTLQIDPHFQKTTVTISFPAFFLTLCRNYKFTDFSLPLRNYCFPDFSLTCVNPM